MLKIANNKLFRSLTVIQRRGSLFAPRVPIKMVMASVLLSVVGTATADEVSIYRCEAIDGVIEYSNTIPKGTKAGVCKQLDLPSLTTIPAPSSPATSPNSASTPDAKSNSKGFPKVSTARQQRRDDSRREILRDELASERDRLTGLRGEFKDGEPDRLGSERNYQKYLDRVENLRGDIARRESNIGALQRELEDINN